MAQPVPRALTVLGSGDSSSLLAEAFAGITAFVGQFPQGSAGAPALLLWCCRCLDYQQLWVLGEARRAAPVSGSWCQGREEGLCPAWPWQGEDEAGETSKDHAAAPGAVPASC